MLLFPLSDERHSIIAIWTEYKIALEQYAQYDPDGRIRIRNSQDTIDCSEREMQKEPCLFTLLPHFGFTGAFRSQITGLSHMGARWYSARLGQFVSPDPLWYIDSFDLYAYAAFDPINNWDPTGMASAGIGATGQGQRSLGAPGGLGPRSQAAEEFEWARSGFAIHYGPSQSPGGHISRARTPLYQTLGEGAQPPQPPRPRAELLPAYTRQPRASFARVTRDGDDISIHVNLYFRSPVGVEITDDMIATWVNTAEQVWTGEFGRYHVTTNITPRRGRRPINRLRWRGHEVLVYEAVFRHRGQERIAEFNRKNGQIRISANVTGFVFSHEFGHALGQGDRYYKSSDVERDIKRNNPWPGWEGNIMTTAPNKGQGEVWEENITHILETHKLSAP